MKLLFENWRQYLLKEADPFADTPLAKPVGAKNVGAAVNTSLSTTAPRRDGDIPETTREKYFGANPDNLPCIQDLRKPPETKKSQSRGSLLRNKTIIVDIASKGWEFYDCMESAGYNKIGEGSFRAVFDIPNKPDLVLKTPNPFWILKSPAHRRDSLEMNKKEAKGSFQTASDLVVKAYDSAEDYFWIVSEKVTPIRRWSLMQEFFPVWKYESAEDFESWFPKLINAKTIPEVAAEQIDKRAEYRAEYTEGYEYEKKGKELVNDPLILDIRDLLGQFKLPAWDIRPHNVGYAMRDGKKQFVVIDPGFGLDEWKAANRKTGGWSNWQQSQPPENKKDIDTLAEELNFLLKEDKVPDVNVILYFKPSKIHGKGIFAGELIPKGADLGVSHMRNGGDNWIIPDFGRYHNHSEAPNCRSALEGSPEDNTYIRKLIALEDIGPDEEITVDYRLQPELEQPGQWVIK